MKFVMVCRAVLISVLMLALLSLAVWSLIDVADSACAAECQDTTLVGLVPLTELEDGTYEGQPGGLYLDGGNETPAGHLAAGLAQVAQVVPRDTLGLPDPAGLVGVLVLGFSMTHQTAQAVADSFALEPWRAPWVQLVNGAAPGKTADLVDDPGNPYWLQVMDSLAVNSVHPRQVQVLLVQQTSAWPTEPFGPFTDSLRVSMHRILAIGQDLFPNVAIAHIWGREFGGYATIALNPEPWAYQTDFAMRQVIQDQIDGHPDMQVGIVPWTDRGPYLWANGNDPREIDGLFWVCRDFSLDDGTHYTGEGARKAAHQVMEFIRSHPAAQAWFGGSSTSVEDIAFSEGWIVVLPGDTASDFGIETWYDVNGRLLEDAPVQAGVYMGVKGARVVKVVVVR